MPEASNSPKLDLSDYFHYGQWRGAAETISGRGSTLAYTEPLRESLPQLFRALNVTRLLDAPCGDFNWMKTLDLGDIHYTGMDIVEQIVIENKEKYSGAKIAFRTGDITRDALPPADLIMVRDCLFHLPFASIADFFENYLRAGIRYLLLTNNANPQNVDLAIPGQYRPVNFLKPPFGFPEPDSSRKLRDYPDGQRERYMYLWTRDEIETALTPRALSQLRTSSAEVTKPGGDQVGQAVQVNQHLLKYIDASDHPETLSKVIATSYDKLGFFTKHAPRAFEYPWIVEHIPVASRMVIDLGAGLSPVPFLLAERGAEVLTVDYSDTKRTVADRSRWNEWGFLDYGTIDPRITSRNEDFSTLSLPGGTADTIYSISVIEHMPAAIRRGMAATAGRLLRAGGSLVLTLDLVPRTHNLWNRDRGQVVESPQIHGTLNDFLHELATAGLALESLVIKRALPGSATDIACLVARKV